MNLWAKSLRQLAVIAVALFFFSCEDDTISGYKTPNSRFKTHYIEIPLTSTVQLIDSVSTTNSVAASLVNRHLVGSYSDPVFGQISAKGFTRYAPLSLTVATGDSPTLDSVTIDVAFDLYFQGSATASEQTLTIYQLADSIDGNSLKNYRKYINTEEAEIGNELGSITFNLDPPFWKQLQEEENADNSGKQRDTTYTLKLNEAAQQAFGDPLFASAVAYRTDKTANPTFGSSKLFWREFYGLALVGTGGDKLYGINPGLSRIHLHYHTSKDTTVLDFAFNTAVSFSNVTSDRSATALAEVQQPYVDYLTDAPTRYIQNGIGVITKIDLTPFLEFADTIPDAVVQSAQLLINNVESPSTPPNYLAIMAINDDNYPHKYLKSDLEQKADLVYYNVKGIRTFQPDFIDDNSGNRYYYSYTPWHIYSDAQNKPVMGYSADDKRYSGSVSLFFQQLFYRDGRTRPKYFGIYPVTPELGKATNGVSFPADQIILKLYCLIPETN